MEILLYTVSGLLALIVFGIAWGIFSFNRLRALEARCDHARRDIDVQLKRRADLFPNLVETVRSFVGQENNLLNVLRDVQRDISSSASIQNRTKENANISNNFSNLFASLEQIPELRSSAHYVSLRSQIIDTEERIAASRRFLNLASSEFTVKRNQFPGALIASIAHIGEKEGYDLGADRVFYDEAPAVKL